MNTRLFILRMARTIPKPGLYPSYILGPRIISDTKPISRTGVVCIAGYLLD